MGVKSHYKSEWIGKTPMCAICAGKGHGPRALHHLTHGVSVWLCEAHRSVAFQRSRAGRDFVVSLAAVWRAAGTSTRRHEAALTAHLRRVRPAKTARRRPGSYAWPALRHEAEARWAAGEPPTAVIRDLTDRNRGGPHRGPSRRTLRRWFHDGRWVSPAPPRRTAARPARHPAVNRHPSASPDPAGTTTPTPRPPPQTPPQHHPRTMTPRGP